MIVVAVVNKSKIFVKVKLLINQNIKQNYLDKCNIHRNNTNKPFIDVFERFFDINFFPNRISITKSSRNNSIYCFLLAYWLPELLRWIFPFGIKLFQPKIYSQISRKRMIEEPQKIMTIKPWLRLLLLLSFSLISGKVCHLIGY